MELLRAEKIAEFESASTKICNVCTSAARIAISRRCTRSMVKRQPLCGRLRELSKHAARSRARPKSAMGQTATFLLKRTMSAFTNIGSGSGWEAFGVSFE